VDQMNSYSTQQFSEDDTLTSKLNYLSVLGTEVSSTAERRLVWLEIIRSLNAAVPRTAYPNGKPPSPKVLPFEDRTDIHILSVESKKYDDLALYFSEDVKKRWREEYRNWAKVTGNTVPEESLTDLGPTGVGWVFEMRGYHYYNSPKRMGSEGSNHVRKFLITNLMKKPIDLPDGKGELLRFMPEEVGLRYPLLLNERKPMLVRVPNPDYDAEAISEAFAKATASGIPIPVQTGKVKLMPDGTPMELPMLEVLRHDFVVQVVWQETTLSDRLKARVEKEAAEKANELTPADPDAVAAIQ